MTEGEIMELFWSAYATLFAMIASQWITPTRSIGICYGMLGDNLPSPAVVVALYGKCGIKDMRLFSPNPEVQQFLRHTSVNVALGVRNEDLGTLAGSLGAATDWVNTNMLPYREIQYSYVTVGNEAIPGDNARYIAPAMTNLRGALDAAGLTKVKVTTVVSSVVLGTSYPPSQGAFSAQATNDMAQIIHLLSSFGPGNGKLMVNVYPYFAYAADPSHISLAYAQFFSTFPIFNDGNLGYYNLFDAMVDAFYSAMDKVGGANVGIVISESGWPSAGNGELTTPDLAQRYNLNFMNHIKGGGTPKRPNSTIDGYIFAMFNEDQKPAGVEQNFGLFYPNGQPVYPLF